MEGFKRLYIRAEYGEDCKAKELTDVEYHMAQVRDGAAVPGGAIVVDHLRIADVAAAADEAEFLDWDGHGVGFWLNEMGCLL